MAWLWWRSRPPGQPVDDAAAHPITESANTLDAKSSAVALTEATEVTEEEGRLWDLCAPCERNLLPDSG